MKLFWNKDKTKIDKQRATLSKLFSFYASRANNNFESYMEFLPNPDLILKRQGKGLELYDELLYDAHLMSCYQSRKSGVLSFKWSLYVNSNSRRKSNSEVYNLIYNVFENLDLPSLLSEMLDAVFYGYKPMEIMWKVDNGYIIPESIIGKPPEWFFFDTVNQLRFRHNDFPNGLVVPDKKFLIVQHNSSYKNPYGMALLARCYWPVIFKKASMKFWVTLLEKFGTPFLHGKIGLGKGMEEFEELFRALEMLRQDGVLVTEEDVQVNILEASKTSSYDTFYSIVRFMNGEISKAILSQTLTTEQGDTGSYAMSQTHLQVRKDVVDSDKQLVEYWLNKLIEWIIEFNFESVSEMPRFVMYEEQDVDMTLAQRDQTLSSTGQVKFTKEYFKRNYGFKDDEIEISFEQTKPQFSESDKISEKSDFDISQFDVLTQSVLKPILEMINESKSYNEIQDKIIEMFPELDTTILEEYLAKGILLATGSGIISAK